MRERSQTTPRRRGPKQPLPTALPPRRRHFQDRDRDQEVFEHSEPPYYSIDTTEEIYGTTLLPSQRCYVDPWDLENYDYVRKKLDSTPSPSGYYESPSLSLSPSPAGEPVPSHYFYSRGPRDLALDRELEVEVAPRMAATMPRDPERRRRRASHLECQLECCAPRAGPGGRRGFAEAPGSLYGRAVGAGGGKYEDYMAHMAEELQLPAAEEDVEQNIYTGYGGFSSSNSSNERHSSIGEESVTTLMLHTPGFGAMTARRRSVVLPKPAPQLEFPAPPPPPPLSPYDPYGNPYATLPYCSVSDCYECLYAAPSLYGGGGIGVGGGVGVGSSSVYGTSTLGSRRPGSSLYGGIYANKFGLSKKGLLQIDYSCSWNDLDRVMGRQY